MHDAADLHVSPDADRKRAVLHDVAAYRDLCRKVRRRGTQALIFGGVMLALWYFQFVEAGRLKDVLSVFSLLFLATAALEFVVGVLNRVRPSAEGVLLDGILLIVFSASTLGRQYLMWQGLAPGLAGAGRPSAVYAVFALVYLWQGVNHVRSYADLRRRFVERPTASHLRWFEELLFDIRQSDPESDPLALDLPARTRIRGKLLGDTALFLVGGPDQLVIADRDGVEIVPEERSRDEDKGRLPRASLTVDGHPLGRFRLHPENWRNYAAWKAEGQEPPVVYSKRR